MQYNMTASHLVSEEKMEARLKAWLHIVARAKTIPKEFVCGEDCEQHALYGRLFDAHPLERINRSSENESEEDSDEDGDEETAGESEGN